MTLSNVKTRKNITGILTQLFNEVESEKGSTNTSTFSWYGKGTAHYWTQKSLNYAITYEEWFNNVREKIKNFVEIGICDPRCPGSSLKVWYKYFINAKIWGLDNFWDQQELIDKYLHIFNNDRTQVLYCNQNLKQDINNVFQTIGNPDIIIEDGSHWPSSIMICWATCFPYIKPGGYYIIEDLQTEKLLAYQRHRYAYDNLQITNALHSFKQTGFLPRLYVSQKEHQYLLDNTSNIVFAEHCGDIIARIQKK